MHKFSSPYLYTNFWIPSELPIDLTKTAGRGGEEEGWGQASWPRNMGVAAANLA